LTTVTDRCLAAAAEESSSLPKLHLEIQHVVHFIGLVDVKPNLSGELRCDSRKISFVAAGASAEIPTRSIVAFSIELDTVPLIKGKTGQVAAMAAYGAGQAISMIRCSIGSSLVASSRLRRVRGD
jgi:hypothetical protein